MVVLRKTSLAKGERMPESLMTMGEKQRGKVAPCRIAAVADAAVVVDTQVATHFVVVAVDTTIASAEDRQAEAADEPVSSGEDILSGAAAVVNKLFVSEVAVVGEGTSFVLSRQPEGSEKAGAPGAALKLEETPEAATGGDMQAAGLAVKATAEVEPHSGWGPRNEVDDVAEGEPSVGLGLSNIGCCTCWDPWCKAEA